MYGLTDIMNDFTGGIRSEEDTRNVHLWVSYMTNPRNKLRIIPIQQHSQV